MVVTELYSELSSALPASYVGVAEERGDALGNEGQVLVRPSTEEEICRTLSFATKQKQHVTVEGAGTKRGFGGTSKSTDLLLSLRDYHGIVEHTVGDMTVTVKAGTNVHELQAYLAEHQQKFAFDLPADEEATIGGIIASNESGPKRLGYGSARDQVIGLRVIYPDGRLIRTGGKVVKNVAGYDMNKLFIGAMGTLGVISEVTMKLRPLPKHERLLLIPFANEKMEDVRSFAVSLLDSMLEPVALEIMNATIMEKLTGIRTLGLALSFEDVEPSVDYQEKFVRRMLPAQTNILVKEGKDAHSFWENVARMGSSKRLVQSSSAVSVKLKIGVKNLRVFDVLKEAELLEEAHGLTVQSQGGLGHGLCIVCLSGAKEDVIASINSLRSQVEAIGGYVVVTHAPLAVRETVQVWGKPPTYFPLLEGIKRAIDPNRLLNQSRFVGGI
ncbi:FAD-binding oxidoreductase [Shouchella shacheensis]|uniref:FAD-binding oxidoreductase n=1 Tax=Shouchella shacheensis TaxID=1649580 RepID=UPI0007402196|nr:FAD-binding oxidoreductase [Shouchella shacheensis]